MSLEIFHLAVIGSRFYPNRQQVADYFQLLQPKERFHIISGGAEGVDSWADDEAHKLGIPFTMVLPSDPAFAAYPPEIRPLRRNQKVVELCDGLVAFWSMELTKNGYCSGTVHAIKLALEDRKLIKVYTPWGVIRPEVEQ